MPYRTASLPVLVSTVILVALASASCTVLPRQSGLATTSDNVKASNDQIRTQVFSNALLFSGAVRDIANRIMAESDDPDIRRNAMMFKIQVVSTSQIIMAYHDPLVSILDLWAYALQLVQYYSDGEGRNDFGPFQADVVAMLQRFPPAIEHRAMTLVTDTSGVEAGTTIRGWADAHPIIHLRQRPWMVDTLSSLYQASGLGAAGAMGVMAERISNLSDRIAIYYALLPDQARWEAQVFLEDFLKDNEKLRAALDSINSMTTSLGQIAQIAETGSPLVDSLLATVRRDARLLLDDALDSVEVIRLAAFADAHREIDVVLAAVRRERVAVMATLDSLTQARIDQSVREVRSLVWVAVLLGAILLLGPFIMGFVVGRVLSRQPNASA